MGIVLVMCFYSLNVFAVTAAPTETYVDIVPFWTHITRTVNDLQNLGGGRLSIHGGTQVQFGFVAETTIELQQNGRTIRTWNTTGGMNAAISTDWFVARGHQYRLRLTHRALNANGAVLETVVMYSRTVSVN